MDKDNDKISITYDNEKIRSISVDHVTFQKMLLLYNAIEDGWSLKKRNDAYIFTKNHEGKKEVFLDSYLTRFVKENFDIQKLLS
jgi:hypothetical protein